MVDNDPLTYEYNTSLMTLQTHQIHKDSHPYFSIIILLWKSNQYIFCCLDSLKNQTFRDFEIIILNNGSPEPIPQEIFTQYPTLNINYVHQDHNLGFASGNNFAASYAKGRFVVLLNSDAFPRKEWLESVYDGIQSFPNCSFASKLIMANEPEKLDGEGDVYHFTGLAWRKSYGKLSASTHAVEGEVFSACGAAAIYPKEAFDQVGGFDPDYFAYVEDVDLGFRLRLAGYRCVYLPAAEVLHVGSGSTGVRSDLATYYGHRNLVWTYFKNMPLGFLIGLLPFHLLANLMLVIYGAFSKRGAIIARAKIDAIRSLSVVLGKRRAIQKNRKITSLQLLTAMDLNPFTPLTFLLRNK